jgi:hypothetical protein
MDFIDRIRDLAGRIAKQRDLIQTEEATKNAMIMPFLSALGYDVFNPTEVTPELNADIGIKKGEKVDYAILRDGKPIMLFECKQHTADLAKVHASQLYRYFSVTEARFGVLTNGILYWFYTDLDAPNKMDNKPFFEFNLLEFKDSAVEELKKFTKSAFDVNHILTTASELKYTREVKKLLFEQLTNPSDDFVKPFAAQVFTGRMNQAVRDQFAQIVRLAFKQIVNDQLNERLKSALASDPVNAPPTDTVTPPMTEVVESQVSTIVTTDDEREAYHIIRAILRDSVPVKRIVMRDVQSYCGVLLDDNNRKPICRLRFTPTQKIIGFFSSTQEGKDGQTEERIAINSLDELYQYADRLKSTVARYDVKR